MGLARRIIPVLLMRDSELVKGKMFDSSRVVGHIQQAADIYQARGVDELIVLDVGATLKKRPPDFELIRRLTDSCFMPVAAGGGIRNIRHVRDLLANGADKVVIGTCALTRRHLVAQCADKFGSQAITVAVDCRYDGHGWFVTSRCGTETWCWSPVDFAKEMERQGAGELIVTGILNEGMMGGYDIPLIRKIAKEVSIPVIANGGCGSYEHMHKALKAGADAVAAGAAFQFLDMTPRGAAEYLAAKGWETRL